MQIDDLVINRRAMLGRALLLLGATALPIDTVFAAQAKAAQRLLSAPRFALLSAVADTIIPRTETPGASDVGVPVLLDGMLRNWAAPGRQQMLIGALDEIDGLSQKEHGKSFVSLDPQTRTALLTGHDVAALRPAQRATQSATPVPPPTVADPNYGRAKQSPVQTPVQQPVSGKAEKTGESNAVIAGPTVVNPGYQKLKELIVTLYYYSEPALTQELTYEHSPGAWQPSIPITPETRAEGGVGLF